MSAEQGFSNVGFAKQVVLPALLVFLIPVLGLGLFGYAEHSYDSDTLAVVMESVAGDATLSDSERASIIADWQAHPMSERVQDPVFAQELGLDSTFVGHYRIFRWMIALSFWSITSGVLAFVLAGASVLASRYSQKVQFVSLFAAWHGLRAYAAAQVVIQGVLLVAMSFWITALFFNIYVVKLVFITGAIAFFAAVAMLKAMWVKLDDHFDIEGEVIARDDSAFWNGLDAICEKVGTAPPDQLIAGIDTNFFVTEHPVTVNGTQYTGRTLFVSLSLLKQLDGQEADAVLAHEMAHFSGQDTTFSKRTAPLLQRWDHYIHALFEELAAIPIAYFLLCFRTLFHVSLRQTSREREYRADRIAAQTTSPEAVAGALLRIAAYTDYRGGIERDLFGQEQALQVANISERIETGFGGFAVGFGSSEALASTQTAHPFDTHPKLQSRLEAVGVAMNRADELLGATPDGAWFSRIPDAENREKAQWEAYERRFREMHEEDLAWRYLPETDAEQNIVLKFFPRLEFGSFAIDHHAMHYTAWDDAIALHDIHTMNINDAQVLCIYRPGELSTLPLASFGAEQQQVLAAIQRYVARAQTAVAYQQQRAASPDPVA